MPLTPFFGPDGHPDRLAVYEQALLLAALSANRRELAVFAAAEMGMRLVTWFYQDYTLVPSWALYDDERGNSLVTLSGTQNPQQCLLHLGGAIPVFPIPGLGQCNMLHYDWGGKVLKEALGPAKSFHKTVHLSGHSYGGSIVSLMAEKTAWANNVGVPGEAMSFAAPRSWFGSQEGFQSVPLVRVSGFHDDPVPHIPPQHMSIVPGAGFVLKKIVGLLASWYHVGVVFHLNERGGITELAANTDDEHLSELPELVLTGWGNHAIAEYLRRIELNYED